MPARWRRCRSRPSAWRRRRASAAPARRRAGHRTTRWPFPATPARPDRGRRRRGDHPGVARRDRGRLATRRPSCPVEVDILDSQPAPFSTIRRPQAGAVAGRGPRTDPAHRQPPGRAQPVGVAARPAARAWWVEVAPRRRCTRSPPTPATGGCAGPRSAPAARWRPPAGRGPARLEDARRIGGTTWIGWAGGHPGQQRVDQGGAVDVGAGGPCRSAGLGPSQATRRCRVSRSTSSSAGSDPQLQQQSEQRRRDPLDRRHVTVRHRATGRPARTTGP